MKFKLGEYIEPDFSQQMFTDAPEAVLAEAPQDSVAPDGFHVKSCKNLK